VWIHRADTLWFSDIWIDLDQDRTKCRVVVSTVMNAIVQKYGNFMRSSATIYLEFYPVFVVDKL